MKFLLIVIVGGCSAEQNSVSHEPIFPSFDSIVGDAPDSSTLVDEKTDEILPTKFLDLLQYQSPVKDQGYRGTCVLFVVAALVEHMYKSEGTHTDLDLSEQFLVWASKQIEANPEESASISTALQAVNHPGTIQENLWPYESKNWTEEDDPACTGDYANRPIRCYTNGEPTENARNGRKYRIPRARWMSTNPESIKAFMFERQFAVPIGVQIYEQAWSMQATHLPIDRDYYYKGQVLFPNEDDIDISIQPGHAILLVGWDDEMELPRLDKDGNNIVDDNGDPVADRGCFLFKNSWGTDTWGIENSKRKGYGWIPYSYIKEHGHGAMAVDEPPDPNPPREELCCDDEDDDWDGHVDCDDPECSERIQCGDTPHVFEVNQPQDVPYYYEEELPFESALEIPAGIGAIRGLTASFDLSFSGDCNIAIVEAFLVNPSGTSRQLVNIPVWAECEDGDISLQHSFFVDDFNGQDSGGSWKLRVLVHEDYVDRDLGVLNKWSVKVFTDEHGSFESDCSDNLDNDQDSLFDCDDPDCQNDPACAEGPSVLEYENNTPVDIPDDNPTGTSSSITVTEDVDISKLELEVEIDHSWGGDIELRLEHPDGTNVQVLENSGKREPVAEHHVVEEFVGKNSAGRWTLIVIDHEAADEGILTRWAMKITSGE
jgi:subtilisin-like proprotein convertase family protein/C1A family cysteine protease